LFKLISFSSKTLFISFVSQEEAAAEELGFNPNESSTVIQVNPYCFCSSKTIVVLKVRPFDC
jgi:hypothetical protein